MCVELAYICYHSKLTKTKNKNVEGLTMHGLELVDGVYEIRVSRAFSLRR